MLILSQQQRYIIIAINNDKLLGMLKSIVQIGAKQAMKSCS
jgi:hypothetical protein